ncbi:MAG: nuclear transport factor 2 family protein [Solirubrobacteraceae bacterium]
MGARENKQSAQQAYAAFARGDAEAAMADIDESIAWTVRGDNALTGTHRGLRAVGDLWARLATADYRSEPHEFIADGDKVVVLSTTRLGDQTDESVDVLTYNAGAKLILFDSFGNWTMFDRAFPK